MDLDLPGDHKSETGTVRMPETPAREMPGLPDNDLVQIETRFGIGTRGVLG